jgi:hypothetical protein
LSVQRVSSHSTSSTSLRSTWSNTSIEFLRGDTILRWLVAETCTFVLITTLASLFYIFIKVCLIIHKTTISYLGTIFSIELIVSLKVFKWASCLSIPLARERFII